MATGQTPVLETRASATTPVREGEAGRPMQLESPVVAAEEWMRWSLVHFAAAEAAVGAPWILSAAQASSTAAAPGGQARTAPKKRTTTQSMQPQEEAAEAEQQDSAVEEEEEEEAPC